jgi:hypothetical protein
MSWLKPVGKRALRYGPQAALVWKHAGKPAAHAAQRIVADQQARRTALKHAETVEQGAILKVFDQGSPVWVVFSGPDPVAAYPPREGELADLVSGADPSKKMTPELFRARKAERSARRKAARLAGAARENLRRRRSNF